MPDKSPADTEQIGEIRINGPEKDERKRVHKDSNLDSLIQSQMSCRWTISQNTIRFANEGILAQACGKCKP